MKKVLISLVCLCVAFNSFAQQDSIKWRFAQMTFFYPMGTNGTATDYTNIFSFNILAGVNGGLRGVEFGGLVNVNTGNVFGLQHAGVANINVGNTGGFQFAGVLNVNAGKGYAGQFASVFNLNTDDFSGVSTAAVNINAAGTFGGQVAPIINYTHKNVNGAQIAGVINIAGDTVNGTQIGLINKARVLNGTQIGLVNIVTDTSFNAVPIGLFNYNPSGVAEIELAATEVLYGNMNIKFGGQRLYTIFKTGFTLRNALPLTSLGMGLGTRQYLGERTALVLEAETSQLNIGYYWDIRSVDMLSSLGLHLRYEINGKYALSAGPLYNAYFTQEASDILHGNLDIPYTFTQNHQANFSVYTWLGGRLGFAFLF